MKVRKLRSKSEPRDASSSCICAAVSIPGISISCSIPFICILIGPAVASGTRCSRSASQLCISTISSFWALMMREASVRTIGAAPCDGAIVAMTTACA